VSASGQSETKRKKGKNMKTQIPTQAEYERNEALALVRQLDAIRRAPLRDRVEAREAWAQALKDPGLVAERVGWLLNGSYGYGACLRAKRIMESRGNKVAALAWLTAALEWNCPAPFAVQQFILLSATEQTRVNDEIAREIETTEVSI
jgi:hypothetical protein